MSLTDVQTIRNLAKKFHLRPSALAGQNFLIDQAVLETIIKTADIKAADRILEIGPGFGALTAELLARAALVVAVERDNSLVKYLQEHYAAQVNLKLIAGDALKINPAVLFAGESYRLIANIPYSITGQIVSLFLSGVIQKPADAVLLIQKEVGERICAGPGNLSLPAIAVQLYGRPKIASLVSRASFWPEPKVDSAILQISDISQKPRYRIRDLASFWRTARKGFSSPRKQLHNNLGIDKSILAKLGINEKARAQELTIEQWIQLDREQSFLI